MPVETKNAGSEWGMERIVSEMHRLNPGELEKNVKKELFRRKCVEFVEGAVKIEDKDVMGLVVPFTLWPDQKKVLRRFVKNRRVVVLKARQLGLTWLALAYACWRLVHRPGYWVVALSKREDPDAKELIRRVKFILRHLPDWMIREKSEAEKGWNGAVWEATALKVEIQFPGQEPSVFQSMTSSPESGRSFTANLILFDEWAFQQYAEELWAAGYPVINRPTGGQVIGLSTGNRGTLFESIWNGAVSGDNNFKPIFLPWNADPRRTSGWYKRTRQDMPNSYKREYPRSPDEAFTVGQGAFFPEWDFDTHVMMDYGWYPPDYCQIYGAYDAGYGSRACFKWYAVFPDGRAVGYREYYPHQVTDLEQAKQINKMSLRPDGTPERLVKIFADPSCWNKQSGTGESTAEVFLKAGIRMLPADNDLANGWRRLHQWLGVGEDGSPHLSFTHSCGNTIRTYPSCEQSKTNPEDIARNSEHHPQDVDRYFVMGRPAPGRVVNIRKQENKLPPELREDGVQRKAVGWFEW